MTRENGGYEVGRGKPPKETRFAKGRSGNPKGRPKGTRNLGKDLEDILTAKVTVTENGRPKKVSTQMATLMRLREKALKGDLRAIDRLLEMAKQLLAEKEAAGAERSLSAREEEILERYFLRRNVDSRQEDPGPEDDGDGR